MVRGNGFKAALTILRVKDYGHSVMELLYVELE